MGTLQFFQPPNVIESASSLLALRDQIEGRSERRNRQQRESTTQQLAGLVLGNDPAASQSAMSLLQQHDPGAALALREQQGKLEQQRLANDQAAQLNPLVREGQFNQNRISEQAVGENDRAAQAKKYVEVRKQTEEMARLFGLIENDPNQWPDVRKEGIELGILPPGTPETFPTEESMKATKDRLEIMTRATKTPEAFKAATDAEAGIENMRKSGIVTGKEADDLIRRFYKATVEGKESDVDQQKATAEKLRKGPDTGARQLPAGVADSLGSYDSAVEVADRLLASWKEDIGRFSAIMQYAPYSSSGQFDSKATVAAQTIGKILEGGKLVEAEFKRYKGSLPTASDGDEKAEGKVQSLKDMLALDRNAKRRILGQTGWDVSGIPELPVSGTKKKQATKTAITPDQTEELGRALMERDGMSREQALEFIRENYTGVSE